MINGLDMKLMADDTARAYRRAGFQVHTSPFRYSFPPADVTNAGIDDQPVTTETGRDSIFVWLSTSVSFRDLDHGPGGILESWFAGFSLQLTDEASGYRLVGPDRLLPHQALAGQDGAPFVLGFPYVLPPGSRITATFRGSGEPGTARLSLDGIKLFTTPYTLRRILPDVPGAEAA